MNVVSIPIALIDEDLNQPRNYLDEDALTELAESIKDNGLLSPIKVYSQKNGQYKIIYGNRRFKAFQRLGYESIPCILSEYKDEEDIFLQQLTENMQREGFTPIEEAEAFRKAIETPQWNMTVKFLAGKLGKKEKYISDKLSLLNFGNAVKQIIHNGTQIISNKLTEAQVLPLKDLPVEYRDQLAMKVAVEAIPVEDAKRIAKLFSAKDINPQAKEIFLNYNNHKLIEVWDSYEFEQKLNRIKGKSSNEISKPILVTNENNKNQDIAKPLSLFPIEEKAKELLGKIPRAMTIPDDIVFSIQDMRIDNREEFMITVDCIIENLEMHLMQWKAIKEIIKKDRVRRVK
ncbi:MAG: ParB/RepB/Spo0J family partition protein [Clostridiaceae bacterium]|nr:ParB/RepB/Spo0J family partition protein [Clostridiaceae bacterium]